MIIVNARFLTQKITGVQRFGIEISKELQKLYPNIIFISPKNVIHTQIAKELNVKYLEPYNGHLWEQITLAKYVKKEKALLLSLCNTAPIFVENQIITIHDICFKIHPEWFSKVFSIFYNFIIPRIINKSRHIFTVSNASKNEIAKHYNISKSKITVIYNAVAEVFLREQQKATLNDDNLFKKKYILTVSSHHPRKNFKRLIQAFNSIDSSENIFLYIIGNVNNHFSNENIINTERILFLNNVSDEDLLKFYSNAALFVYPSLYEGFGIPIIEASSQNVKVCVSDIPIFHEVCGDGAVYFNPYDSLDIKNKILLALEADNTSNLLDLSKFSWSFGAKKIQQKLNLYIK